MADLWFSFKMIIITGVLIVLLQIRIGENTLEEHAMIVIKTNPGFSYVQEVAHGGVVAIRQGFRGVAGRLSTRIGETIGTTNAPGDRSPVDLKRSQAVLEDLAEKAKSQSQSIRENFRQEIKGKFEAEAKKVVEDTSYEEILYKEPVTLEE